MSSPETGRITVGSVRARLTREAAVQVEVYGQLLRFENVASFMIPEPNAFPDR
jgi:ribosome recycling factor